MIFYHVLWTEHELENIINIGYKTGYLIKDRSSRFQLSGVEHQRGGDQYFKRQT